jgi:hypothetical protein
MRTELCDFMVACEVRLKEQDENKGPKGWIHNSTTGLTVRLSKNLEDLANVETRDEYLSALKDIANYAMMLYDRDVKGLKQ